jgi:hypothetical protein
MKFSFICLKLNVRVCMKLQKKMFLGFESAVFNAKFYNGSYGGGGGRFCCAHYFFFESLIEIERNENK